MAYIVRENDFASFELVNAETDEVIAIGSHPQDLCELAINLLPCEEVSCLAEVLSGEVRRTIQPLSAVAREALVTHQSLIQDWQYEVANGDTRLGFDDWLQHIQERDLAAVSFNGEPFGDIRL